MFRVRSSNLHPGVQIRTAARDQRITSIGRFCLPTEWSGSDFRNRETKLCKAFAASAGGHSPQIQSTSAAFGTTRSGLIARTISSPRSRAPGTSAKEPSAEARGPGAENPGSKAGAHPFRPDDSVSVRVVLRGRNGWG